MKALPFFCSALLLVHSGMAQKLMKVPDSLSKNASLLEVTRKNSFSFPKYEMEGYKVVSGKQGWGSSSTKPVRLPFIFSLLTREQQETIKEKSSFVFAGIAQDTAIITIAVRTNLHFNDPSNSIIKALRGPAEYQGGASLYTANIQLTTSDTPWELSTLSKEAGNASWLQDKDFTGLLTDGARLIQIRPVTEYFDGKKDILNGILGMVFQENGETLAAIQFRGLILKQQKQNFIWLSNKLGPEEKLLFASAATALMARAHQLGVSMDNN